MNDDNFFSINRLVEFGMGLAVAQQMVKTMNSAMTNMHIPGSMNPMQIPAPQFYYAIIEGNQAGPFSEQELSRLIADKIIVKETFIWKPSLPKWEIAEKLPEILKLVALAPPPFNLKP
ncbi:DUF4339 domain-containing protein [Flavobacterium sp.]|uniref:DUF4339 domain-containing protein n=1 Tax=Flavobacterium sp. TaxID=239 RepID=UPI002486E3F5|nr:DUF4339 domain-containing protein [Flavobacterium sp.]MDI1317763.1 DUF4339 domain-containing protein [Flavobacterium sp.]